MCDRSGASYEVDCSTLDENQRSVDDKFHGLAYLVENTVGRILHDSKHTFRAGERHWNMKIWLAKVIEAGLLNGRQKIGPVS